MTNVLGTSEKLATRAFLFGCATEALEKQGWTVERIARSGKASVRRIMKGRMSKTVSIRTSQDTWIAFPRNATNDGWATLADVDYVVAASVDDREKPRFAQVHLIEGDEMRSRFDRAYAARKRAGYTMPLGRGVWLSLYERESDQPVTLVGAGAGLDHPAIARVPLAGEQINKSSARAHELIDKEIGPGNALTAIAEAKRRLAQSLGVKEENITITITS